tara:strand:- start:2756 stop:3298 length:543 start_codon:yes stop_codon:yes gene_type:complete
MKKVHSTAEVSNKAEIGEGTVIWHHVQVRDNVKIGGNCNIGKNVYVDSGVIIGDSVKVENNVSVYNARIGDDVFIGPGVMFTNDKYPRAFLWDEDRMGDLIVVGKGASIGANSTLITGVKVNDYAMVGAGSVVSKDVPKHALVLGVPAKIVGFVCKCGRKGEVVDGILKCEFCGEVNKIE